MLSRLKKIFVVMLLVAGSAFCEDAYQATTALGQLRMDTYLILKHMPKDYFQAVRNTMSVDADSLPVLDSINRQADCANSSAIMLEAANRIIDLVLFGRHEGSNYIHETRRQVQAKDWGMRPATQEEVDADLFSSIAASLQLAVSAVLIDAVRDNTKRVGRLRSLKKKLDGAEQLNTQNKLAEENSNDAQDFDGELDDLSGDENSPNLSHLDVALALVNTSIDQFPKFCQRYASQVRDNEIAAMGIADSKDDKIRINRSKDKAKWIVYVAQSARNYFVGKSQPADLVADRAKIMQAGIQLGPDILRVNRPHFNLMLVEGAAIDAFNPRADLNFYNVPKFVSGYTIKQYAELYDNLQNWCHGKGCVLIASLDTHSNLPAFLEAIKGLSSKDVYGYFDSFVNSIMLLDTTAEAALHKYASRHRKKTGLYVYWDKQNKRLKYVYKSALVGTRFVKRNSEKFVVPQPATPLNVYRAQPDGTKEYPDFYIFSDSLSGTVNLGKVKAGRVFIKTKKVAAAAFVPHAPTVKHLTIEVEDMNGACNVFKQSYFIDMINALLEAYVLGDSNVYDYHQDASFVVRAKGINEIIKEEHLKKLRQHELKPAVGINKDELYVLFMGERQQKK